MEAVVHIIVGGGTGGEGQAFTSGDTPSEVDIHGASMVRIQKMVMAAEAAAVVVVIAAVVEDLREKIINLVEMEVGARSKFASSVATLDSVGE